MKLLMQTPVQNGTKRDINRKAEEDFCLFYTNFDRKYSGVFYDISNKPVKIWLGYYIKYGFNLAFFMSDDKKLRAAIKKARYHFKLEPNSIDEGPWFSIKLRANDKISKDAEAIINNVLANL
ncbi:MAG: hypothetical protein J5710_09145 [Treponema sp.]|nr:hypothetical protein [Treponema sp.]